VAGAGREHSARRREAQRATVTRRKLGPALASRRTRPERPPRGSAHLEHELAGGGGRANGAL